MKEQFMSDASYEVYKNISSYKRLEELIDDGETEDLYIECKSCSVPRFNKEMKIHLAKAISGFTNTSGGNVIWGISTTKHSHSGLDVLTQIEPIGNIKSFAQQVNRTIPTLTTPSILSFHVKIIKKNPPTQKVLLLLIYQKQLVIQCNLTKIICFILDLEMRFLLHLSK
jgi:predicted HTH transcriptional regulator